MTWEFWFTIIMTLILIGTVIWVFVGIKKKENPVRLSKYLFAYRIIEDDTRMMPTVFLVNWKFSKLGKYLYLLYLTLEEDLYIGDYLHSVWFDYDGLDNIYIDVYKVKEDTKHTLIGKFYIVKGRMCYIKV